MPHLSTHASRAGRGLLILSLATLVLLSLINLSPRIYGIPRSSSLSYPEGWNAYHTATILQGGKPYETVPQLVAVNYPPLFWELVALLSRQPSDIVTIGRLVSLVSLLLTALLVGVIAFRSSGSKTAGLLACLLLLAWLSSAAGGYMVTNEPQMLAHALVCGGLLAYITVGSSSGGLLLSSVLFCLALFVKNNVIAVPLAVSLHLLIFSRRNLLRWVLFTALNTSVLLAFVLVHDGPLFLHCLLTPRSYDLGEALHGIRAFVDPFQVPLVVAAIWCCYSLRDTRKSLFVAMLVISLAVAAVFRGGGGTNFNMFFDAIISLVLICSLAFADLVAPLAGRPLAGTLLALSPLFLCIWPLTRLGPSVLRPVLHGRQLAAIGESEYIAGVDFLKSHPGPAICETMRLCFDAGKPLVYDPYYVREQVKIGRLKDNELAAGIEQQRYSTIQFDKFFDLPAESNGRLYFSDALLRVIQRNYAVGLRTSSYVLLVPKTKPATVLP
jgi:hypothetical protein